MNDELQFFQSWWKILRKYWNPPEKSNNSPKANEFWDGLMTECKALHKQYEDNKLFEPFALKMVLNLMSEVERRSVELYK